MKRDAIMKRIAILLGFVILCLAIVGYSPTFIAMRRAAALQRMWQNQPRLVLDAATQAVLTGADRVETFRLVDPNEDQDEDRASVASRSHGQSLDHHPVLHTGPPQGRAFATALGAALSETPSPTRTAAGPVVLMPSGFDPNVGFRVWKGQDHTDVCVGLDCGIVEIITRDARHKIVQQTMTSLGASRPAFFTLSRQAFPHDQVLAMEDERGS